MSPAAMAFARSSGWATMHVRASCPVFPQPGHFFFFSSGVGRQGKRRFSSGVEAVGMRRGRAPPAPPDPLPAPLARAAVRAPMSIGSSPPPPPLRAPPPKPLPPPRNWTEPVPAFRAISDATTCALMAT